MISLLIPTRGRPNGMHRVVATALAMADEPSSVEAIFYIDADDNESYEVAQDMIRDGYPVDFVWGPRVVLSECWNRAYFAGQGPIYGHMGDDIAFRSNGWDSMVESAFEAFEDRICFVHGRDGIQDYRLGTHGFLHRNWVEAVGHFVPPHFAHDYNDTWLTEVADAIGRRIFVSTLCTEHLHYSVGKSDHDQTYKDHEERGKEEDVSALYRQLAPERESDIAKLGEAISQCAFSS